MGKFDLDQKYDETQSKTYTLIDLIHEIITEHGETYETCVGAEYSVKCKNIKYKFKNKDKSGIIDKLNMYFNFDVEQLGKKSPQESFKMLQLLNYLYKLDKHKRIKKVEKENKSWEEQQEIDIIFLDMLNKPHIENINTTIPAKSRNGKVFENVRSDINKMVPEYIKMYKELIDINEGWQYFLRKMLNCIIENLGHDFTEVSTIKLKCIYEILQENIYFKIENISTQNISSRNIFETFWCIINTHPFLCRTYENEANKKIRFQNHQQKNI